MCCLPIISTHCWAADSVASVCVVVATTPGVPSTHRAHSSSLTSSTFPLTSTCSWHISSSVTRGQLLRERAKMQCAGQLASDAAGLSRGLRCSQACIRLPACRPRAQVQARALFSSQARSTSAALAEQQVVTNDPAAEALLALLDYSLAHPNQQQLGGPGGHPVLRLLLSRLQDGSAPGARGDGFKLGLVVEGGGMRGIVTGAMLMGLQDMGLVNVFDAVYGASAGAINSTYFLSGQPEGLDIYTSHLAQGERFLSLRRLLSRNAGPVMDLDYLLDDLMADVIPLDWDAVIRSDLPLKVVASSLTSLRSEVLDGFTDRTDLVECLKASANVPEIVGGPRSHRGHQLVDAAVFEPLPIKAALRDGCTHVLALCSRPYTTGPAWGKYLTRALHNAIKYWLLNPPYMREAWRVEPLHATHRGEHLDDLLLSLMLQGRALELDAAFDGPSSNRSPGLSPTSSTDGGEQLPAGDGGVLEGVLGGHVFPLFPGAAASFAPVCTDVPTLQAGRQEGYRSARKLVTAIEALDRCSARSLQL